MGLFLLPLALRVAQLTATRRALERDPATADDIIGRAQDAAVKVRRTGDRLHVRITDDGRAEPTSTAAPDSSASAGASKRTTGRSP